MARFGLIGRNIDYSFSRGYFAKKFEEMELDHSYENFDLPGESELQPVLQNLTDVKGYNVTIPYKQAVIPLLDRLDEDAEQIGAVNTIKRTVYGELHGYNTDHIGFARALESYLPLSSDKVLVLGTGGASKAVVYALKIMGYNVKVVSRSIEADLTYSELNADMIAHFGMIVNCTPLGTHPEVDRYPDIPYEGLKPKQLLFDLIYNPAITQFMAKGEEMGCQTSNGYQMLVEQAEAAWAIWNP
ncbi:shikimate dehydrogenase family protein [Aureitalea marina]|uniref:Shikimate dehydrogenase n=1 Tax=Aureitalea marina TaxID=930804 RepID=A0A2S7KQ21_9FLAO|nr:shikimate dehydrogenase [Aureitalea marina]PQB04715.1 shikimate dehydrogenase [Aureitalea marina]